MVSKLALLGGDFIRYSLTADSAVLVGLICLCHQACFVSTDPPLHQELHGRSLG